MKKFTCRNWWWACHWKRNLSCCGENLCSCYYYIWSEERGDCKSWWLDMIRQATVWTLGVLVAVGCSSIWMCIRAEHGVKEQGSGELFLSCSHCQLCITIAVIQQPVKHKTIWMQFGYKQHQITDLITLREEGWCDFCTSQPVPRAGCWSDHQLWDPSPPPFCRLCVPS